MKLKEDTLNRINEQPESVILITGGIRRIGAGIAHHLHDKGYAVALHYHHSMDEGNALMAQLNAKRGNSCQKFMADLTDLNAIEQLVTRVIAWRGRLDGIVNNASIFFPSEHGKFNATHWDNLFNVNARASFYLSEQAYPHLAKARGVIINITDIHAEKPLRGYSVYCMSKAALVMQTKALALEYAPDVRVNAVAPGAILWPEGINQLNETQRQAIIAKTPLKQHGNPEFIAQAVAGLIENSFITGQVLAVDGGRSL